MKFLLRLCENLLHVVNRNFAVHLFVYGKHGRKTATTYATRGVERKLAVGRGFARLYAEFLFEFIEHVAAALYVACGAETYAYRVFSLGIEIELRIERGYSVYLFERNVELVRNARLHLYGQITVYFLRLLKRFHKRSGNGFKLAQNFVERFVLLGRTHKIVTHVTLYSPEFYLCPLA